MNPCDIVGPRGMDRVRRFLGRPIGFAERVGARLRGMTTREKAQKLLDETPDDALEPVVEILASRVDSGTADEDTPAQKRAYQEAIEFLRRLDSGEDDRFDWSVSEQLHASR